LTLLVQITDTHILSDGELLYGDVDTAEHLRESVAEINAMKPQPDLVMITGDLVEKPSEASYAHFDKLIAPLKAPAYLIPGNHDDPRIMEQHFAGSSKFPGTSPCFQYAIEEFPFRVLALNSHFDGSELPDYGTRRLKWLEDALAQSGKPTLIAIHHPPMKTGIYFIDMAGEQWYQGLREVLSRHPQVQLVICGHGHSDLVGRIGTVPVYMVGATAHQLIAGRVTDRAPAFHDARVPPMLHHWLDGAFISGYNPWPAWVDEKRIDKSAGMDWEVLKDHMRGTMKK
jgi:3',5'-cyclic AMP phosphodiesterase CpdA